jgi:diguanylate cyclase (GGDEF)-like protein/PAS domain S-box-containing protein
MTTAGFAVALSADRWHAVAGGSLLGVAIVSTHVAGLKAVAVAGVLHRHPAFAVPLHIAAVGLSCTVFVAMREFDRRLALVAAASLLALATCGFHVAAVGALSLTPDASMVVPASYLAGSTLTIVVACATAATMITARVATIVSGQWLRDTVADQRLQHELLQEREEELKKQIARFDMALTSMPHGLCMMDADMRLVVCNKRYADIYAIPPELTKPGTPLAALLDHRIENRIYTGPEAQTYREQRLNPISRTSVKACQLSGGRTVLTTRRPTADGGWIAIHEDITERRRLEETEREAKEILAAVFDAVPAAIICLAPDQRVMLWSRGAEQMFGYRAEDVIGQPYKLVPPGGQAEFDRLFEHVMAGEMLRDVRARRRRKDGTQIDISFSSAAMRDSMGNIRGIAYAVDDLTEVERLNARLEARNEQLDAALNNMTQGLAMFDSEERLVVCNRLYGQMYGLTAEQTKPGTTMRQILAYRMASGAYETSNPADFVEAEVQSFLRAREDLQRLADGRLIQIRRCRMANGSYVVTHEDVTARENLSARLAEQNDLLRTREEELNTRNMQLDGALEHMLQGLAMFDSDLRLVVCNRLYAEMYGLTPEQVKPGTTVREIFEYRMANGFYHVKDTEAFVDGWAGNFGERSARIQELADGRIIAVSRGQTADGGRVVTHEDITSRHKLVTQLEQQHQRLKSQDARLQEQNVQLDAALNNMVQGLAMFDSELRIVIANTRYAEMYGLTPDQAKPGTKLQQIVEYRIANGDLEGKTADEVMEAMLARVTGTGECQYTTRLADRRYISVSAKPLPNGHMVTTHHDVTEQRQSEAKIVHMAMHDALTGLPNRVLINERLEHGLARTNRGEILALHLLDLDHFKNVNDTLGHPAGDKLLKAVTARLGALLRDTDTIARMGGDEFAILQTAISQPADASSLARRIVESVGQPYDIEGQQVVIGASIGIAIGPSDGQASDQLIRNADLALYRAKGDGRGMFCFFEPQMDAQMQERRAMEHDLRKALTAGEFELFYQPVVNLATNLISGCEALIRWRHPEKGLIAPLAFIPLAEEIGFIIPLGDWALREACATAARWPAQAKIAVNLSPVQFRSAGLMQTVVGALAASGLAPDRLELEITETILLEDSEATLATLYQLRELGVRIAMDDFGTGYSSLSYLQSFPFDRIKIDRSFIKDIGDGVGSLNIVRAVAALAAGLGMDTTAEGVETEQQRETVRMEGCTEMQGFLFSRPRPAREIEELFFPELQAGPAAAPADDTSEQEPTAARAGAR